MKIKYTLLAIMVLTMAPKGKAQLDEAQKQSLVDFIITTRNTEKDEDFLGMIGDMLSELEHDEGVRKELGRKVNDAYENNRRDGRAKVIESILDHYSLWNTWGLMDGVSSSSYNSNIFLNNGGQNDNDNNHNNNKYIVFDENGNLKDNHRIFPEGLSNPLNKEKKDNNEHDYFNICGEMPTNNNRAGFRDTGIKKQYNDDDRSFFLLPRESSGIDRDDSWEEYNINRIDDNDQDTLSEVSVNNNVMNVPALYLLPGWGIDIPTVKYINNENRFLNLKRNRDNIDRNMSRP